MMRGIIDATPDAITITRFSDGTYKAVNEGFVKQLGFTRGGDR